MYHADLHEEIRFLKARLLYKTKKLTEAKAANEGPEKIMRLQGEIRETEEKLHVCQAEAEAVDESEKEERQPPDPE